jgi:pimeloyl-ACP methyl ester carboxylesterase
MTSSASLAGVVLVHGAYADGSSWSEVIERLQESLFHDRTTVAAWRSKPSWYAISRQDRTTSPELERFLAHRMNATTIEIDSGHLSLITHPQEVTQLILDAVQATAQ